MKRKRNRILILFLLVCFVCKAANANKFINNEQIQVRFVNTKTTLWQYKINKTSKVFDFEGPQFEIDGKQIKCLLSDVKQIDVPKKLNNGVIEYLYEGRYLEFPDLSLRIVIRMAPNNPILRFRYELLSTGFHELTKINQKDNLSYLKTSFTSLSSVKEIRFSEFNEMVHSFSLSERVIGNSQFINNSRIMGPVMMGTNAEYSFLIAYEHGSQVPDHFVEFKLSQDRKVELNAVKGNYFNGYAIDKSHSYKTIWLEAGAIKGDENALAKQYRSFILHYMSPNLESRKPYIFYNTWNFQERNKHWYKKPYLASMTLERMLEEIEVAHKMGIEVFVIDAGWFEKSGDWSVSLSRFPDGLKTVKAKLDAYGMKLGLWFNPNAAAISSNMLKNNKECVKTIKGEKGKPYSIWETEESFQMCLVSRYRDAFADELIRLYKELGVTYFKWDAVDQYGCDDAHHLHGTEKNSLSERSDCYAFEGSRSMSYIVDKLCAACPEAIVDFDITEGGRSVGLGFLASGKYFLINNGPYYQNYNIPNDGQKENTNIFFYPGPARGWICRTPLTFDKWFPSVLFLTHYLPDDPYENQSIAVGSLILGQNGIWGDLPKISKEGVDFFGKTLGLYKQVRDDITQASMIRDGAVGGSPEVYEKINPQNGKGAIVIFSSHPGKYTYISQNKTHKNIWSTNGTKISFNSIGNAIIDVEFTTAEAKIIYFGVKD